MERFVRGLARVMAVISALAIVVLMFAIIADVTSRFFTGRTVPAMLEISESALVVSIFFGLAWAGVTGAHVAVTLLSDRLGPGANRIFEVAVWTLGSVLTTWFIYGSIIRAISATRLNEIRMGLVQWSMWPLRWVIVAGFVAFLLVCLVNLVRALRGRAVLPAGTPEELQLQDPQHIDSRSGS